VVTGGASGIGAATTELLRAAGARVVVLDIAAGSDEIAVDLADREQLSEAVRAAVAVLGEVDTLVNCAGVSHPSALRDLDLASYDLTLAVNLHAPVLLTKLLGVCMAERGYGRIVNVSSVHARLSEHSSLAYDVSKAGLEAATRTAALELAERGVLVNAVAPGFVTVGMGIVDGVHELDLPPAKDLYLDRGRLPLRRAATPTEVAGAIAFLASEANTYITGQTLTVDGGLSSRF